MFLQFGFMKPPRTVELGNQVGAQSVCRVMLLDQFGLKHVRYHALYLALRFTEGQSQLFRFESMRVMSYDRASYAQ
ncbi:hypothetical protein Lepil_3626 [Leptonema illini DSM 21528]|uniref:Uncharacterized protein n=2 Tax=Leptonema illini TaxID=183 RepID=H2CKH8_9LEPT|nr:hypothetical protein Lepil_3626 [Leptonema illini DSM 21528]